MKSEDVVCHENPVQTEVKQQLRGVEVRSEVVVLLEVRNNLLLEHVCEATELRRNSLNNLHWPPASVHPNRRPRGDHFSVLHDMYAAVTREGKTHQFFCIHSVNRHNAPFVPRLGLSQHIEDRRRQILQHGHFRLAWKHTPPVQAWLRPTCQLVLHQEPVYDLQSRGQNVFSVLCAPRSQHTSQDHVDLAADIHAPCRQRGFAHLFDVPRLCGTESLPSTSALFQGCALLTSWIFKHNILTTPSTATAVAAWWTRRIASARLLSTARVLFALPALARHLCT